MWKSQKFSREKFREINWYDYTVVRAQHSVEITEIYSHAFTVWKLQKFSLTLFWQKFRESNGFTKEITK